MGQTSLAARYLTHSVGCDLELCYSRAKLVIEMRYATVFASGCEFFSSFAVST